MTKNISALQNILVSLFEIQRAAWFAEEGKWKPSPQALKTYKLISEKWEPIAFAKIKYLFKQTELVLNFSKWGQVLYLPPLKKDANFVPVLSLSCKLNETQSIAKFRVMLVCLDNEEKPYGIGFRMETPESMNQEGEIPANGEIHDFYHAQLIQRFGQRKLDNKLQIHCPSWIPDSQPSFPLPADCPVTLLLCLIVTLYGRKCYNQFVANYLNDYRKSDIEPYKKKLKPWINWNSIQ